MPVQINGNTLKHIIISASNNLYNNRKAVDDLNVFPVPDGDTGTNMSLTISAVKKVLLDVDTLNCGEVAKYASSASLRGARGNSGVILSQLFKGFYTAIADCETINIEDIKRAMESAKDAAYNAVSKPTEGTVLTVARVMAEKAAEYDENNGDITLFLKYIVKEGNKILAATTDMLPQLRMANVVDAGGKGLMVVMEGALYYLENGSIVPCKENIKAKEKKGTKKQSKEDIKFGYCTEFIINKKETEMNWQKLKAKLEKIGDCVVVVDDFDIIKVHVHTNNPGIALEEAIKYGSLINIKIDNMREQAHNETVVNEQPKQEMPKIKNAFITVSAGEGLSQMFTELGCTGIITGGQTMNPSTEDFMSEIEKINAENIFILPNNKKIIMAAQQAVDITDKNVVVIKTRSIVQGIAAMIAYDEEASFEENTEAMNSAIEEITSASVTFAARDCVLDELEIKENDVMGLIEGKINLIGNSPEKVCKEIVQRLVNDETSSISIYRGEDAKEDLADALLEELEALYPDLDVNIYYGGQPLYYYYISAE